MLGIQAIREIQKKKILPVYVLWGTEAYLKKKIIDELRGKLLEKGLEVFNYDYCDARETSLEEVLGRVKVAPVAVPRRLVVVTNASFFSQKKAKDGEEAGGGEAQDGGGSKGKKGEKDRETGLLVGYLENPLPSACLVFLAESITKTKKATRAALQKKYAVDCSPVSIPELKKWIRQRFRQQGKTIEDGPLQLLVDMAGNNLYRLENEINKICSYLDGEGKVTGEHIRLLVTGSLEVGIFALVDSIGRKDKNQAIYLLRGILQQGESPLIVLAMIARQFRLLLQARWLQDEGYTYQEILSHLKTHSFVAKKILDQGKNFTREQLGRALILAGDSDYMIKTGQLEPCLALEILVARVMG